MMQRRNFITGTVATALALTAASCIDGLAAQPSSTTFTDDDTLVQRTAKLNALMGTDYEVDVTYPQEWNTWWPTHREELLGAQFPRLVYNPKYPFEWSVFLKRGELQCTHKMTPFEFFHWTSTIAWQHRMKNAAS